MELNEILKQYLSTNIETIEVYVEILSNPCTEEELVYLYGDISKPIDFLSKKHLIINWKEAYPNKIKYMAVPPEHGLSAILLQEAWQTDSEFHSLEDIMVLSVQHPLKKKLEILEDILPVLTDMYIAHLPSDTEVVYEAKDKDLISANLAAQLAFATHEILAVNSPPHLMGEVVWNVLKERMDVGVTYTRITEFSEIPRHGYSIFRNEILDSSEEIFIISNGFIQDKYYIIDRETVAFFIPGSKQGKYKGIQFIKNEGLAQNYIQQFWDLRNKAIPSMRLLPSLENYRNQKIKEWTRIFSSDEVKWLTDVFDNGVFYSNRNYSVEFLTRVVERMKVEHVIRMTKDGFTVVDYDIACIHGG